MKYPAELLGTRIARGIRAPGLALIGLLALVLTALAGSPGLGIVPGFRKRSDQIAYALAHADSQRWICPVK